MQILLYFVYFRCITLCTTSIPAYRALLMNQLCFTLQYQYQRCQVVCFTLQYQSNVVSLCVLHYSIITNVISLCALQHQCQSCQFLYFTLQHQEQCYQYAFYVIASSPNPWVVDWICCLLRQQQSFWCTECKCENSYDSWKSKGAGQIGF